MLLMLLALPDIPDEDRLLVQARKGNRQAIAHIYESYFDPLYQFIRWRVNDPAVAEDLTSEVFIKLLHALQGPSAPHHSLRGWLFRVARNVLHDHYHSPMPSEPLDEWIPAPMESNAEAQVFHLMDVERVYDAVRRLGADQQEVLILRFGHMLSLQDTAESMGRSVSAIKSLQFRAIEALRHVLEENQAEATHGTV